MLEIGGWKLGVLERDHFMMKYLKFSISILLIGLIIVACSGEDEPKQEEINVSAGEHAEHANMQMESDNPTDESVYNISSIWQNRYGYKVLLDSLRGKVQVVAMVYTSCEYACPRILADMKRVRDLLSNEELKSTNFVIVSIDPERDTPDRLRNFAAENDLNNEHWTLLNGEQGDILELAALLGVKYKRISETDFTHSNMLTVLNQQGEVVHQRTKLGDTPTGVVETVRKLVK